MTILIILTYFIILSIILAFTKTWLEYDQYFNPNIINDLKYNLTIIPLTLVILAIIIICIVIPIQLLTTK